jgi:large subunit ribosomal protein L28
MPAKNNVSTKKPMFGNLRSHSLKATRHKRDLNMQSKRIYVPEVSQFVRVQVTANELRTIDKIGLPEFLKRQGRSIKELL